MVENGGEGVINWSELRAAREESVRWEACECVDQEVKLSLKE